MTIITNDDELVVTVQADRPVPRTTAWRRRKRLEELAWEEFVNGPRQTTPHSAMQRALKRFLVEQGVWLKVCPACGQAFPAKRSDAVTCSSACKTARQRKGSS